MDNKTRDVFSKERASQEKFRQVLAASQTNPISSADYEELLKSYQEMLKQLISLTRFSDRNQKRLHLLTDKLKRYVSPPLFKKITSGKESVEINKSKRVKLTIFFSDIVNFSWHSRDMEAETLAGFLNSYLEEMTKIANNYGGTLDKYIGDAIMVFFGDPVFVNDHDHALRCVQMAIAMRKRLKKLHQHWYDLGYSSPLHVRMGISTGYVSVGNFGSSERLDYTIIGTPVNLAARIQSMAEEDQILISHATWALVKDDILCSEAKTVELKGFDTKQLVHSVAEQQDACDDLCTLEDPALGYSLKWDKSKLSYKELMDILSKL